MKALVLCVVALAGCSRPIVDGCAGVKGTCISLVVRAGAGSLGAIDQIGVTPTTGLTFTPAELRSPTSAAKTISLPAVVPILPGASFSGGDFTLSVSSYAQGTITGTGSTSGKVAAGAHTVVYVTLDGTDVAPDLSAGIGDGGMPEGDGGLVALAPRAIAPSSGAYVTTRKPKFTWQLSAGSDGARVEICTTHDCANVKMHFDATGTSVTATSALPIQVLYWRLRPLSGGVVLGTDTSPVWTLVVTNLDTAVASFYGALPDLNSDGFADVVAGAPAAPVAVAGGSGTSGPGRVHVYLGTASAKTWLTTVPMPGFNINDPDHTDSDGFGTTTVVADLDGDGYADIAVGSPCGIAVLGVCGAGRVHLFRGGPNGLSAASPGVDVSISAPAGAGSFGTQLAAADLDLDGYIDLAVLSPTNGVVYVYRGGPTLASDAAPDWTLKASTAFSSLSTGADVDGDGTPDLVAGLAEDATTKLGGIAQYLGGATHGWTKNGTPSATELRGQTLFASCLLGQSVALAGDTNGDGYGDVLVGAPLDCGSTPGGLVALARGSNAGLAGSFSSPTILSGGVANSGLGQAVESAGDVNGDGKVDVLMAAPGWSDPANPAAIDVGHAYVLYGPQTFFSSSSSVELKNGSKASGYAQGLHYAGDIDGDGFDDLVIGSPFSFDGAGFTSTSYRMGKIDIYFGSSSGIDPAKVGVFFGPDAAGGLFGN